jgi:diguanylate cyclase (GGDEF)-like protein
VEIQRRKTTREADYARLLEVKVQERTQELARHQEELEETNRRLAKVSITDALTGLANRRFLTEYIEKEVQLVHRRYRGLDDGSLTHASFDMAFIMIDLDNFKTINDTAGHGAGDAVLRQMSEVLRESCRTSDIVIRWGGDEFLIVARDLGPDGLDTLVERIRRRMESHAFDTAAGQIVRTTCSIGYASYPLHPREIDAFSWEQVISVADRALYVAKVNGRNAWVGYSCNPDAPVQTLLRDIRNAPRRLLDERHIELHTSLRGEVKVGEE